MDVLTFLHEFYHKDRSPPPVGLVIRLVGERRARDGGGIGDVRGGQTNFGVLNFGKGYYQTCKAMHM